MKVTRKCIVCKKEKTAGVGKFVKLRNLLRKLSREAAGKMFKGWKIPQLSVTPRPSLDKYVCSGCSRDLLKEYPRKTKKED